MTAEGRLATAINMLRIAIADDQHDASTALARRILTALGEPHGDEEREAVRRRLQDAEMQQRLADAREAQRIGKIRARIEVMIAEALNRSFLGRPLIKEVLDACNEEAARIARDVSRVLDERPVGTPAIRQLPENPRVLMITWKP